MTNQSRKFSEYPMLTLKMRSELVGCLLLILILMCLVAAAKITNGLPVQRLGASNAEGN